jgi:hypothetical protein
VDLTLSAILSRGGDVKERSDVVDRAIAYPYAMLDRPFVQLRHRTADPDEFDLDRDGRVPLLAYGSNAAPEVLARKLALSDEPALVVPISLHDYDVVYSAHISPYGAIPATLAPSPGTVARASLAYLTPDQLSLVSATEPNYELASAVGLECRLDDGEAVAELRVYLSRRGALLLGGEELSLAAVKAEGRRFEPVSEAEVLERARALVCPEESLDAFILGCVTDPALAKARTEALPRRETA